MPIDFSFRRNAVRQLSTSIGVYVLTDLDDVPVYVGKSSDGIKQRVQRHLTSARSDVIANRQIDVWEIAFVWEYPVSEKSELDVLEAALFHAFDPQGRLMNGSIPNRPPADFVVPSPTRKVQVMSDEEIHERRDTALRLPRQAAHYAQLVSHFVAVKNSDQIARSMDAHFERLSRYHQVMLGSTVPE